MEIAALNRFIPLIEFHPEWANFFRSRYYPRGQELWIPEETVVLAPRFVCPDQARAFRTGLYLFAMSDSSVKQPTDIETIISAIGDKFRGTSQFDEVLLVEVWSNSGDDGHTEWRHEGYRFVDEQALQIRHSTDARYTRGPSVQQLPVCMTGGWNEDR
jgi:hypothetical protein